MLFPLMLFNICINVPKILEIKVFKKININKYIDIANCLSIIL